jgi:16S rRNA (guanine527-N7)-methyltransferase
VGGAHRAALRARGLEGAALERVARYLDLVERWSARVNLTAARDAEARARILVDPALGAAAHLVPGPLLDVGSGNGSPGLVLALLDPAREATLLEPRTRRWAFLVEAARACGAGNVRVLRARHDGYAGAPAANLVVRALRLPTEALLPLVAPGGRLLLWRDPGRLPEGLERVHGPAAPHGLYVARRAAGVGCST